MVLEEFTKLNDDECSLCKRRGQLTGEHKIKASLLRAEFGKDHTIIAGKYPAKILQSPKSKHVHFKKKICKHCNSTQTQAADRAFDQLHFSLKKLKEEGVDITDENNRPNLELLLEEELDAFRYFAKLLCCFLAEVGGPHSRSISAFALNKTDKNPIFLRIDLHPNYEKF